MIAPISYPPKAERTTTSSPDLLSAALSYAQRGVAVFPVHAIDETKACSCRKGAYCKDNGKHPRTPNGFKDATTDEGQIREWWKQWPNANIGTPTGSESGIWVLDVDPRHGGVTSLKTLIRKHGELEAKHVVRTGGRLASVL